MSKAKITQTYGGRKQSAFSSDPSRTLLVLFSVVLILLVMLPLVSLLRDSFLIHNTAEARNLGLKTGEYTLLHWKNLFTDTEYQWNRTTLFVPLVNSVTMAALACVFAIFFGGATAWLITRTDLPCKRFISTIFIFPYIMPSWTIAMYWENLFKNTASAASQNTMGLLESIFGLRVPENVIYGMVPCAICLGIHYAPFAYMLIGAILRNMDANLEEAAQMLKASRWKIMRKVTFPIVKPAVFSTVLLVFASSVSSYTVPMFLGAKGKFYTLSLKMRSLIEGASAYKGQGYVMAILLILFSMTLLLINTKMTGKRKSFATVTGKSGQVSLVKLGKLRMPIAGVMILAVLFFGVFPMVSFALESMTESSNDLSTFTLRYWLSKENTDPVLSPSQGILMNGQVWKAFWGSIRLSAAVSLIAGTCGILIGYAVVRKRGTKMAEFVSGMAFIPYLIPAMSMGAVYLSVSCMDEFRWLYGTFALLIIVGSVKFLPFAVRSGTNAMMQLSGEIEEAAVILGIPWWKRMTRILFPIQKSSFISGYLLPFISSMRELSLFVLIVDGGAIMTSLLSYYESKSLEQISNGINLMIVLSVVLINSLINKVTGASIDKGIGG